MGFIKRTIKNIFKRSSSSPNDQNKKSDKTEALNKSLQKNIQKVKETLGNSGDIVIREIRIGKEGKTRVGVFYTDGLADTKSIHSFVMESLMLDIRGTDLEEMLSRNPLPSLKESVLTVGSIQDVTDFDTFFTSLLSGDTIILVDGYNSGFVSQYGRLGRPWCSRAYFPNSGSGAAGGFLRKFTNQYSVNSSKNQRS